MTNRIWYPEILIDEVMPEGQPTPEAWLPCLMAGGVGDFGFDFAPGDPVNFKFTEPRGFLTVTINPDGTLKKPSRCPETPDFFEQTVEQLMAADTRQPANSFWDWESETYAETLEQFARHYAEAPIDEPMEVEIETSFWSDTFHYRISDDGKSLILQTPPADAGAQETSAC